MFWLFNQVVKRAGNSYYFIGILAVGLAAVIGVGVICVICAVVKMRKRSAASGKGLSNLCSQLLSSNALAAGHVLAIVNWPLTWPSRSVDLTCFPVGPLSLSFSFLCKLRAKKLWLPFYLSRWSNNLGVVKFCTTVSQLMWPSMSLLPFCNMFQPYAALWSNYASRNVELNVFSCFEKISQLVSQQHLLDPRNPYLERKTKIMCAKKWQQMTTM